MELFPVSTDEALAAEVALLPNAVYFGSNPLQRLRYCTTPSSRHRPTSLNLFLPTPIIDFAAFNPINTNPPVVRYANFAGPGDADESYDAADFQNMLLALLTVTPRAQGRVVQDRWHVGQVDAHRHSTRASNADRFLRLDLEDVPLPSFHRPDLVNFWYHRLLTLLVRFGHGSKTTRCGRSCSRTMPNWAPDVAARRRSRPR